MTGRARWKSERRLGSIPGQRCIALPKKREFGLIARARRSHTRLPWLPPVAMGRPARSAAHGSAGSADQCVDAIENRGGYHHGYVRAKKRVGRPAWHVLQ
jgi:hypothetical protein